MSPKKKKSSSGGDRTHPAQETSTASVRARLARIPSPARFFLVVLGSLVFSSILFTVTASWTVGDLGLVSKHLEEWWEVGGLMAWRAVEVGLAWGLGFDSK